MTDSWFNPFLRGLAFAPLSSETDGVRWCRDLIKTHTETELTFNEKTMAASGLFAYSTSATSHGGDTQQIERIISTRA